TGCSRVGKLFFTPHIAPAKAGPIPPLPLRRRHQNHDLTCRLICPQKSLPAVAALCSKAELPPVLLPTCLRTVLQNALQFDANSCQTSPRACRSSGSSTPDSCAT